jgi:multidrug resistance efflux pump
MMRTLRKALLPALAASLLAFATYHVVHASRTMPAPPPPAEPPRTPFGRTVAAAGLVEAQTENLALGAALPGVVLEVYVPVERVGQHVKAGDPLFRVDDRNLRAQLEYQEANLAAAEAQLAKLEAQPRPEEVPPSEAKVRTADANMKLQLDQYERARELYGRRVISAEEYTQRQLSFEAARHQLAQAQAEDALLRAGAWGPDKDIARASVALARAQVKQTRTELERTLVRAPVDGQVLQVNVRPGEYVGTPPGQALVVLGHAQQLHVRADISEHDIDRFSPKGRARAVTRGRSRCEYTLTFVRVEPYVIPKKSLTGDNTERVDTRVLQVIYALKGTPASVYVGQQVDVFIEEEPGPATQGPAPASSKPSPQEHVHRAAG